MPAWSSSIFAVWSNSQMAMCALTGVGVCVMHGHNQDAMNRCTLLRSAVLRAHWWKQVALQPPNALQQPNSRQGI